MSFITTETRSPGVMAITGLIKRLQRARTAYKHNKLKYTQETVYAAGVAAIQVARRMRLRADIGPEFLEEPPS